MISPPRKIIWFIFIIVAELILKLTKRDSRLKKRRLRYKGKDTNFSKRIFLEE